MHASDAARLMLIVMQQSPGPEPINIGYDDDITIAELVDMICELSGRRPRVEFDTSKPEGRFRKCADPTRLNQYAQGYQPQVSLTDGIRRMLEWYRNSFSVAASQCDTAVPHL